MSRLTATNLHPDNLYLNYAHLAPDYIKVRITISLDQEVVDHFKAKAGNPGALPYQTQINQALRKLIDQGYNGGKDLKSELLKDDVFIRKLAKKVGQAHAGK